MKKLKTFDPTIKYFDLQMILNDLYIAQNYALPDGYTFKFWQNDNDINAWINIHTQTGEFASRKDAEGTFKDYYTEISNQLDKRVIFIENNVGEKIATATLSPCKQDINCGIIDWFAISKFAQGKKLSKPLLEKTIQIAKNLRLNKILLHTQTNSWLAAKIYLDFGFEPINIQESEGWDILKTIINHQKLSQFNTIPDNEIYDPLMLNIKNQLSQLHTNFDFNVWYINGRNDVYVREGDKYFEYKFYDNGNRLILNK